MKTRFVAYDRLGAKRGVLPHVLSAEIVPTKNDLPTLILSYNRNVPTHAYLQNEPEIAFEYFSGGKWVEPPNARLRLFTVDLDYLDEVPVRNYSFIGVGEGVKSIFVYGANGLPRNDDGKVQFVATNPGSMLSHVWDQAVKRGWKGFSKSFNGATDSAGRAWPTKLNLSFDDETSFQGMLDYFARLGMIDFNWSARTLNVYVADTALARDLTTGNDPMRFNLSGGRAGIDSAPESNDMESKASHVIVIGEEGRRWEFPTGAVVAEGRREIFLSYSGVDDEGTARILAAPTIARYSNTRKNTTRQFRITEKTIAFPFIDYTIGDWCWIEKDDAEWERVQIFQMSLLIDSAGVQGYVSLGDKIDSLIERLDEAVQRIQGGSISEGNNKPAEASGLTPSAPMGVLVTAQTFWNVNRELMSVVAISWSHDGKDVKGDSSAIVSNYYVEVQQPSWVTKDTYDSWYTLGIVGAGDQFYTHTGLPVKDRWNNYANYRFRVRAESSRKKMSAPSSVVSLVMPSDKEAPKRPATPIVTTSLGVFTVSTTHLASDGSAQPNDYSYSTVEMAESPTGPWNEVGRIAPPTTSLFIGGEAYGTRWFRLTPVDMDGNRGEWSAVASATSRSIVDEGLILTEIDAGKTKIINAGKIVLENGTLLTAKLTANDTAIANANSAVNTLRDVTIPGLNSSLSAATGRLTTAEGKITTAQAAITTANGEITKIANRVDPIEQGMNLLNNTTIPNLTKSINGKTTINRQTTVAANPATYSLGDRWEQWDKLTAGGKLLKTWRHNGTAWIEEILSASYLPQVDIGAGTFGSLDGGRLTANSVSTQSLTVGSFSNLIENGNFDLGQLGWGTAANWSIDPTGGRYGTGSLKLTGVAERTFGPTTSPNIPIEFGDSYRLSAWIKTTSYFAKAELCLYYYRADGSYHSNQNLNFEPLAPNEWKRYSGIITPNLPAEAGPVYLKVRLNGTMVWAGDTMHFDDVTLAKATDGKLIVSGSITGDSIDAESVAAKVGTFIKVNVQDLVATNTSKLNDVVAQKIAAGTASFQTVDAKNIFVTGTASLSEVVAKRLAAETGIFLTLSVDQLTVTGAANMKEVVADRMFSNLFDTRKLTANQVLIGHPGNILPDPMHLDPVMLQRRNASSTMTVTKVGTDLVLTPSATSATYFRPYGVGQNTVDYTQWLSVKPGEVWRWTIGLTQMRAAGWMGFVGRTNNGQAYANPVERTTIPAGFSGTYAVEAKIPDGCYWIIPEMMLPAGTQTTTVDQGSMTLQQVMTPELIVNGSITTEKLTVTEEMTAALLKAKKVEAGEINFNSLFGDNGFIGNLKTTVLTSNVITTDLLGANAITAKHTITGALVRSAASGARTEMTNQGIRVVNSSNIDQVRLGYGIATGMAVLNPYTGVMTPLQQHVFGTTVLRGTLKMSSTDNAGVAFSNSTSSGWALRVMRDSTYQPVTFTAQSTRAVFLIQMNLQAWVSTGLKTNGPESIQASTEVWIRGNGSTPDPLYQMNIMPPMTAVPYRMASSFTSSIMHHIDNLVIGNSYQIELRLRNEDKDTTNGRLFWSDMATIIMPV